jgi:eukaryotic-like serine/threonine-protein kinase
LADIGDQLRSYRLDEIIGRGGFAVVYRTTHLGLDIERAVKVLDRKYSDDTQIRQLFQREARRAARLSPEFVVEVYDAGETSGEAWIASELMTDGTLADALESGHRFSA